MKVTTHTRTTTTVEHNGIEVDIESKPVDDTVLIEKVGDTHLVVAYLVQDEDIDLNMGDCMGRLYSFHRFAPKDQQLAGLKALGRNEYGDIDSENITPDPYAVLVDCYDHGGQVWSVTGGGMPCNWDTDRGAGVWVPDDCLREQMDGMGLEGVEIRNQSVTYCKQVLTEYNELLAGNVYGCVVEVFLLDNGEWAQNEHDSCWRNVGFDYAKATLKSEFFNPTIKSINGE